MHPILAALEKLDNELTNDGLKRTLTICGGAALIVLNITSRATRDVDVIAPEIDAQLKAAAVRVANELGLDPDWLNNGPANLAQDLSLGWKDRVSLIHEGKSLEIYSIGRLDLIASKMFAYCDRNEDLPDMVNLKPTREELESIYQWVLERDTSELWPKRVNECFAILRKKLGHE